MIKKLFLVLSIILLTGCLSSQPDMTLSNKMNSILMDDTLTTDQKMLRLKMLEMEMADQERQRIRRAEAFTGLGEAFNELGKIGKTTIHQQPVYKSNKDGSAIIVPMNIISSP